MIGSRKPERAEEAAAKLREAVPGAEIEGLPNDEAAKRGPIVFLTVPFRAQSETLTNLKDALTEGQLLVDCTVPLAAAISRQGDPYGGCLAGIRRPAGPGDGARRSHGGLSASHGQRAHPGDATRPLDEDVLVCGDRKADKARVAEVIELVDGLRAVNAGPLERRGSWSR